MCVFGILAPTADSQLQSGAFRYSQVQSGAVRHSQMHSPRVHGVRTAGMSPSRLPTASPLPPAPPPPSPPLSPPPAPAPASRPKLSGRRPPPPPPRPPAVVRDVRSPAPVVLTATARDSCCAVATPAPRPPAASAPPCAPATPWLPALPRGEVPGSTPAANSLAGSSAQGGGRWESVQACVCLCTHVCWGRVVGWRG